LCDDGAGTGRSHPDGTMRCRMTSTSKASRYLAETPCRNTSSAQTTTDVVLEGTLHGGPGGCGAASADGGAAESTGGLHLHSLQGLFGTQTVEGVGRIPDKVKQRLADLGRLWGSIHHTPGQSLSETAGSRGGGAIAGGGGGAMCQGAVVQCRTCRSAVACDSSTILAWLHDGDQGQRRCAGGADQTAAHGSMQPQRVPTGCSSRAGMGAAGAATGLGNDILAHLEPRSCVPPAAGDSPHRAPDQGAAGCSELRDTLSPAGVLFVGILAPILAVGGGLGGASVWPCVVPASCSLPPALLTLARPIPCRQAVPRRALVVAGVACRQGPRRRQPRHLICRSICRSPQTGT
jgi:hypothetical protein